MNNTAAKTTGNLTVWLEYDKNVAQKMCFLQIGGGEWNSLPFPAQTETVSQHIWDSHFSARVQTKLLQNNHDTTTRHHSPPTSLQRQ